MGATLGALTFSFDSVDHETVHVDEMGDGCLVLSALNHLGVMERIAVSYDQLSKIMDKLSSYYGEMKNTDRFALAAL